jgi:hypothetical protein
MVMDWSVSPHGAAADVDGTQRQSCGDHATAVAVTVVTRGGPAGHFRCDIKGLGAESVKLIEDFRRSAAGPAHLAQ